MRYVAVCALLLFPTLGVANGINPPSPDKVVVLSAKCESRDSSSLITLYRASLRVGTDSDASIQVRSASGQVAQVHLKQVARIELLPEKVGIDGYTPATLDLTAPEMKGKGAVKLGVGDRAVKLVGFDSNRKRVIVPLANCKAVAVAPAEAPPGLIVREEKKS